MPALRSAVFLLLGLAMCEPIFDRHSSHSLHFASHLHPQAHHHNRNAPPHISQERRLEVIPPVLASLLVRMGDQALSSADSGLQTKVRESLTDTVNLYVSERASSQTCLQAYFYKVVDKAFVLLVEAVLSVLASASAPFTLAFTLPSVFVKISELVVTMPHLLNALETSESVREQCDKSWNLMYDAYTHHYDKRALLADYEEIQQLRDQVANNAIIALVDHTKALRQFFEDFSEVSEATVTKLDDLSETLQGHVDTFKGLKKDGAVKCLNRALVPMQKAVETLRQRLSETTASVDRTINTEESTSATVQSILDQGMTVVVRIAKGAWSSVHQLTEVTSKELDEMTNVLDKIERAKCSKSALALLFPEDAEEGGEAFDYRDALEDILTEFHRKQRKLSQDLNQLQAYFDETLQVDELQRSIKSHERVMSQVTEAVGRHEEALSDLSVRLGKLAEDTRKTLTDYARAKDMTSNELYRFLVALLDKLTELRQRLEDVAEHYLGTGALDKLGLGLDPSVLEAQRSTSNLLNRMFDNATSAVQHGADSDSTGLIMMEDRWDGECGYAFSRARTSHVVVLEKEPVWQSTKVNAQHFTETICDGAAIFTPNPNSLSIVTMGDLCHTSHIPDPQISIALFDEGEEEIPTEFHDLDASRSETPLYSSSNRRQIEIMADASTAALQCYVYGGFGIENTPSDVNHPLATYTQKLEFSGSQRLRWYVLGVTPNQDSAEKAVIPGCVLKAGEGCVWVLVVNVWVHHIFRFDKLHEEEQPLRAVDRSSSKVRHEVLSVAVREESLTAWACAINARLKELASDSSATVNHRAVAKEFIDEHCTRDSEETEQPVEALIDKMSKRIRGWFSREE